MQATASLARRAEYLSFPHQQLTARARLGVAQRGVACQRKDRVSDAKPGGERAALGHWNGVGPSWSVSKKNEYIFQGSWFDTVFARAVSALAER